MKAVSIIILVIFIALFVAAVLWLFGRPLLAAVVATAVVALLILLIVLVTAQLTRRQTIETMQIGANIALRAQEINDAWDARKTKVIGDVMREGFKFGQKQPHQLPAGPSFPPLLSGPNVIDAPFTIAGLDNDEIVELNESEV